jgi:hypothetical protein
MSFLESKTFKPILVGAVIVAAIVFFSWPRPSPAPDQIEQLNRQNDSLKKENVLARQRDSIREIKVDSLLDLLQRIDAKIKTNKDHHEIIIHSYDTATTGELEQFFSDRYHQGH